MTIAARRATRPNSAVHPLLQTLLLGAGIGAGLPLHAQQAVDAVPQEVVVTAQKRSTLASKTPVSLAVVSGDDLKANGAEDTKRLAELMPNVQLGNGSLGGVEVSIRGIGANNNTEMGDPAVGLSIDGVYLGRPQMAGASLYDIERVEVLRGPQGTLYGRNATAGAINIITNKPSRQREASASLGFANYRGVQADAMLNLPVNDSFSLRGVVSKSEHDGYVDTAHAPNTFQRDRSDRDNLSARLHGLIKFGASGSLLLSGDYSQDHGAGPGAVPYATLQANPKGAAGRFVTNVRYEGINDVRATGLSAEWNQGLGFADLTAIAAHRTQDRHLVFSVAAATAGGNNFASFEQDTLEVRLASAGKGPVQWVAGVYHFDETGQPLVLQSFGAQALFMQRKMQTTSNALFGQASAELRKDTRLTLGWRQTQDAKERTGCTYPFAVLNAAGQTSLTNPNTPFDSPPSFESLPPCPAANVNNVPKLSWKQATYRLGVDHDLDPNTLVFATYATGFKAGGFNDGDVTVAANTGAIVYNPEKLASVELGIKGRYLDRRLQLAATVFSYDYSDLQVLSMTTCASGIGTCGLTQNAGKAKSQGMEVEGRWSITPADQLSYGLGLTRARYTRFITSGGVDWSGVKLDKSPASVANLGYTHVFTMGSGATLAAYVGLRYSAKYELGNPAANAHFTQSSFHKTDMHLTWSSADDRYSVQAYARNLEDRNVATSYQFSGGQHGVFLAEPRIFGIRLSARL